MDNTFYIILYGFIFSVIMFVLSVFIERKSIAIFGIPANLLGIKEEFMDKLLHSFSINNQDLASGDEIILMTKESAVIKGIVIGVDINTQEMLLINNSNLIKIHSNKISGIKIIDKYGEFFISKKKKRK